MAGLKETKRRITSVKNTQKITRAMKLVSSAKYARANQALLRARPFSEGYRGLIHDLAQDESCQSEYFLTRPEKKIALVLLAPDRGLCGGLNANLLKAGNKFLSKMKQEGTKVDVYAWGKRARLLSLPENANLAQAKDKVLDASDYGFVKSAMDSFTSQFLAGEIDGLYVLYPKFRNAMSQTPEFEKLFPALEGPESSKSDPEQYVFDGNKRKIVDQLLLKHFTSRLFYLFLESSTSEHAARMTAMDSATGNADKVIKDLTLAYNRVRQASITKELIEITSGAEAL